MNRANRPRLSRISGSSYASKLLGRAGDGSTLTLDFTTGQLDPRLTFTRASTVATFINASGLVATATTNEPRFDYDPTTLAPKGLLIEGTATNLINWSETFDTTGGATNWNWSALNVTRGTVTTTNPTGVSATVIKVEETTTNGVHAPLTVPNVLASTPYTFSVWAKAVERTFVQLFENGGSGANSMVNLSTGSIVSESTAGITTVTALGTTGWYRISMRLTTVVGQTTANCQLRLSTNGTATSYAGTTGSGIYIWGAQLEAGSGASSYIPTGASTVQRLADECQLLDLTTMGFNASAGTIFVDMGARINTGSNRSYTFLPVSGGNNQIFEGSGVAFHVFSSGSFVAQIGTSTVLAQKIASAYAVNDYAVSVNGGAVATDTSGALPTSLTKLTIGGSIINTAAYQFGCIRTFKYWPTRLPDSQLQSLTT